MSATEQAAGWETEWLPMERQPTPGLGHEYSHEQRTPDAWVLQAWFNPWAFRALLVRPRGQWIEI